MNSNFLESTLIKQSAESGVIDFEEFLTAP